MMRLLSFALLALPCAAQVPVDFTVRFTNDSPSSPEPFGIDVIDPATGAAQAVTGLSPFEANANCGVLDPASGALWTGSGAGPATVLRIALAGSAAASVSPHATSSNAFHAIDLDSNGDLFVSELHRVLKIERGTGGITVWDTISSTDEFFNALTIDPETDRMWVATFNSFAVAPAKLLEYDISAGPGPGTTIADLAAVAPTVSGLTFDGGNLLYLSAGFGSSSGLVRHDLASGITSPVPILSGILLNGLRYHRREDRLHMVGGPNNNYFVYTPSTGQLATLSNDVVDNPADIAINDWTDRTTAYPKRPSASTAFTLEATAHAAAGEVAGVAVTKVGGVPLAKPVILGIGLADLGGFLATTTALPAGLLPQGTALTVQSARVEGGTGQIVFGSEALVTLQP